MKTLSIVTVAALLFTPIAGQADLLGIRAANRVEGGDYTARTKGSNNVANAASIRINGGGAGEVSNRVEAGGTVSASATGDNNMVNSASVMLEHSSAEKVSNRVQVDTITNAVHGNDNVSNIGSVMLQNATAGSVVGAMLGAERLPARWIRPLRNQLRSAVRDYDRIAITDLADIAARINARLWK